MVAVVQLVERQFVVLDVAGSSPVGHPNRAVRGHASAPTLLGSWLRPGRCASSSTAEQRTLNPQVLGSKPRGRTESGVLLRLMPLSWLHPGRAPIHRECDKDSAGANLVRRRAHRPWSGRSDVDPIETDCSQSPTCTHATKQRRPNVVGFLVGWAAALALIFAGSFIALSIAGAGQADSGWSMPRRG